MKRATHKNLALGKKRLTTPQHIPLGQKCPATILELHKIALHCESRNTTAFRALRGKYSELKRTRGVDFHILKQAGFSTQMMMDLGIPTHELIKGYLSMENGLEKLVADITTMHNKSDPHYKKLNFKVLVAQGVPLSKIREAKAQIGLLVYSGFSRAEIIDAGYEASRVDTVIKFYRERGEKI